MKLQFDANQDYQLQAVAAITGIFEGQPLDGANTRFEIDRERLQLISGVGNNLVLSENQIIKNLKAVQERNEIPVTEKVRGNELFGGDGNRYRQNLRLYPYPV
jgi:type III restriction enzyme